VSYNGVYIYWKWSGMIMVKILLIADRHDTFEKIAYALAYDNKDKRREEMNLLYEKSYEEKAAKLKKFNPQVLLIEGEGYDNGKAKDLNNESLYSLRKISQLSKDVGCELKGLAPKENIPIEFYRLSMLIYGLIKEKLGNLGRDVDNLEKEHHPYTETLHRKVNLGYLETIKKEIQRGCDKIAVNIGQEHIAGYCGDFSLETLIKEEIPEAEVYIFMPDSYRKLDGLIGEDFAKKRDLRWTKLNKELENKEWD